MGSPRLIDGCIYAIRCKANGKLYIGKTIRFDARIHEHFYELKTGKKGQFHEAGANFQTDYDSYGADAFEVFILEDNVKPEVARERESYWVNEYQTTDPRFGYNKDPVKRAAPPEVSPGIPPNLSKQAGIK